MIEGRKYAAKIADKINPIQTINIRIASLLKYPILNYGDYKTHEGFCAEGEEVCSFGDVSLIFRDLGAHKTISNETKIIIRKNTKGKMDDLLN